MGGHTHRTSQTTTAIPPITSGLTDPGRVGLSSLAVNVLLSLVIGPTSLQGIGRPARHAPSGAIPLARDLVDESVPLAVPVLIVLAV